MVQLWNLLVEWHGLFLHKNAYLDGTFFKFGETSVSWRLYTIQSVFMAMVKTKKVFMGVNAIGLAYFQDGNIILMP